MDLSSLRRTLTTAFLLLPFSSSAQAAPAMTLPVTPYGDKAVAAPEQRLRETGACRACDLRGRDLSGAHLIGVDLRDADLRDAQVINAYAPNVRTSGMRYAGASLFGSDLIIGGGD